MTLLAITSFCVSAVDVPLDGKRMRLADAPHPKGLRNAVALADPAVDLTTLDPTVTGATVQIGQVGGAAEATLDLPAEGWSRTGAGRTDFKYKSRTGPVRGARLIDGRSIVFSAVGPGCYVLGGTPQAPLGVVVEIGHVRFCSTFGGTVVRDDGRRFVAVRAPAPATCPALGTTTSTSSSTTTSTSSSTTTSTSTTTTSTSTSTTTTTFSGQVVIHPTNIAPLRGFEVGARATTTAVCASSATALGLTCSGTAALLAYSASDNIASMPTTFGFSATRAVVGLNAGALGANWADLLDGSLPNSPFATGAADQVDYFTGANANGTVASTCGGWTSSSGNATVGCSGAAFCSGTGPEWLSSLDLICDVHFRDYLCVCY